MIPMIDRLILAFSPSVTSPTKLQWHGFFVLLRPVLVLSFVLFVYRCGRRES